MPLSNEQVFSSLVINHEPVIDCPAEFEMFIVTSRNVESDDLKCEGTELFEDTDKILELDFIIPTVFLLQKGI